MSPTEDSALRRLALRRRSGMKPGLGNIRALLAALGNPHVGLRYIHVAGTNGKGAVTVMTETALHACGYRTGAYTSPHLLSIGERFRLNGVPTEEWMLERAASEVEHAIAWLEETRGLEITFFEALTAVAFVFYAAHRPDVVVLETGLGGRLDATNVIRPEDTLACVITSIGLDHCDWLGNSLAEIATEKAGILKRGIPLVTGMLPDDATRVITQQAEALHVECHGIPALPTESPFPERNRALVRTLLDLLRDDAGLYLPDDLTEQALTRVSWPGRYQRLKQPSGAQFLIDGAHNPPAITALLQTLHVGYGGVTRPFGIICGFCADKDVAANVKLLTEGLLPTFIRTVPTPNPRTMSAEALAKVFRETALSELSGDLGYAPLPMTLSQALSDAELWSRETGGTVVICGSLFLAGEALGLLGAMKVAEGGTFPNEVLIRN